jgi:hypothetical protein
VLGVHSVLARFEGVLDRHAVHLTGVTPDPGVGLPADHPALYAVLGLIALARSLRAQVERLTGSDQPHADVLSPSRVAVSVPLRDLLV